jgi:hypothetical protein
MTERVALVRWLAIGLGLIVAALIVAGCGGDDDDRGGDAAAQWEGTFDSTFGELALTVDGDQVTGTYEYCSGTLEGTVSASALSGDWTENPDACPPEDTREEEATTGTFEFTLASDGQSFSGTWAFADGSTDPNGDAWEGERLAPGEEGETAGEAPPPAEHAITVAYEPPRTSTERLAARVLHVGCTDGIAEGFTQSFALPTDLQINVVRGNVSPYYDPRSRTVFLSYGFVDDTAAILQEAGVVRNQSDLGRQLASIDSFILVHELGHAFVDVFNLPITGREEDAVDGMATVFFTDEVENGPEYAFYAARFFALLQKVQGRPSVGQFQDEHSLSIQRFYDITCAIAGSSPRAMAKFASVGIFDRDRLARCPDEYEQKSSAWKTLLDPYLRN